VQNYAFAANKSICHHVLEGNSSSIMIAKRLVALLTGCHGGSPPRRGD